MDRDEEILAKYFPLHRVQITNSYISKPHVWIRDILKSDLVYMWFGSYFGFPIVLTTKLLGRKLVIVAGGYDVANAPEINHGTYSKSWLHKLARTLLLKFADQVLTISEFNKMEAIQNARIPSAKCSMIYLAIQTLPSFLKPSSWEKRKNQVVMTASATESSFKTKGIDQFIAAAKKCPDIDFLLVGKLDSFCTQKISEAQLPNLKTTGYLEFHSPEFLEALNQSKIAVQLSFYESFGAAIIDAGMCGCEMVATDRGALPEVVSKEGYIVPYGDLLALEQKIREILRKSTSDCDGRSARLAETYGPHRRETKLVDFIKRLNA
jgi:glycosyltransferase involved in cell wall biosynthesis